MLMVKYDPEGSSSRARPNMGARETGSGQSCSRTSATKRRGQAMGIWKEVSRENCLERRKTTPSPKIITCVIAKNEGAVPPKAKTATDTATMRPASSNRSMEGSQWISRWLFVAVEFGNSRERKFLVGKSRHWDHTGHSCSSRWCEYRRCSAPRRSSCHPRCGFQPARAKAAREEWRRSLRPEALR